MPLTLALIAETARNLEFEGVTPDALSGKSLDEIRRLPISVGNRELPLAEVFDVTGDPSDHVWHLHGGFSSVHGIGTRMRDGAIHIHGAAGRRLGSQMQGGKIVVDGDAGDWAGAEMRGGVIRIRGHAGNLAGAARLGSRTGMRGGTILIDGNAGEEVGGRMRGGWICVGGAVGPWVGKRMLAGTIFVFGNQAVGDRTAARERICPGAGMRRGTIVLFGDSPVELLSSFRYACRHRPAILPLMARQLVALDFPIDRQLFAEAFKLYHGDFLESGRGEILLR